jgi:hypothetical protein
MVCTYTLLQTKPITARQGEVLRMHPLIENGGIGVRKEDEKTFRNLNKEEVGNLFCVSTAAGILAVCVCTAEIIDFFWIINFRALRRYDRWLTAQ